MTAQYHPKTLAKILTTILCHAPAEFGLFWDADGSMPWKEVYWALQEDASLRFVRESTIRELAGLGMDLPFVLDGTRLRLRPGWHQPPYPLAEDLPDRLYYACRRKQYATLSEHGLTSSSRPLVPLSATGELALRLGRRRDPAPVLIEVLAAKALSEGERFYRAGGELYLVASLPARLLLFPQLRADQQAVLTSRKKVVTRPEGLDQPPTPGSFFIDVHHLDGQSPAKPGTGKDIRSQGKMKQDWKRDGRKERHKRSL